MNQTVTQPAPTTSSIEGRIATIGGFHPLAAEAMRVISGLMDSGSPSVIGWSSGKDSSVLVSLVLTVGVERRKAGLPVPPMLVVHMIYDSIQAKRPTSNPHLRAKVRQVLQLNAAAFERTAPGQYWIRETVAA